MTRLNQTITRWQGVGLIATTLLGTGIFLIPQLTVQHAGDKAPLVWATLLLAMLPLTYLFAQLGRHHSHAAGPAYFIAQAFGDRAGYLVGLVFLLAVLPGAAAALMMTFEFIRPLVALSPTQTLGAELTVLMLLFLLNRNGLQLSGQLQIMLALTLFAVVAAMLIALVSGDARPPTAYTPEHFSFETALGLAIWSYLGIEAITHLAPEFRDVKRDFLPASLVGVTLVGIIFIGCSYLALLAPDDTLAMVGAFDRLLGGGGRWVIGVLGLISGLATINVYFASLSRLTWSLSDERVLPAFLRRRNSHNVPTTALMTLIAISALLLLLSHLAGLDYAVLLHSVNGVFVLIYTASALAAWRLLPRRDRPAIIAALLTCGVLAWCLGAALLFALALFGIAGGLLLLCRGPARSHTVVNTVSSESSTS